MVSPARVGERDYELVKRSIIGASYFSTMQIAPNSSHTFTSKNAHFSRSGWRG
jgi:hypothetical protein